MPSGSPRFFRDESGHPVEVFRPKQGGLVKVTIPNDGSSAITGASLIVSPQRYAWVTCRADIPCHIQVGTSSAAATTADHYLPGTTTESFRIEVTGYDYIAVRGATDVLGGTLYINRFE